MDDTERDMFDTMTSTKVIAALCGTFLIFLLGKWAVETVYHVGPSGHGDEAHNAYVIATDDGHAEEEVMEEEVDFATLMASADSGAGEKLFKKCKACHKLEDGANGVGPTLYGVVGRDIASIDGFGYSGAVSGLEGNWTPEALSGFLEDPEAYVADTKMTFKGFSDAADRANIIAYLGTIGG